MRRKWRGRRSETREVRKNEKNEREREKKKDVLKSKKDKVKVYCAEIRTRILRGVVVPRVILIHYSSNCAGGRGESHTL